MREFKEGIPLSFYYLTHCRIYSQSFKGMISREQLFVVLRMHYNTPRSWTPLIIKELESLGLIKNDGNYLKVLPPEKNEEELILNIKKKLNLV